MKFEQKLIFEMTPADPIEKVFQYQTEVYRTIQSIQTMKTFFYLTDLPDFFIENFRHDQEMHFGNLIAAGKEVE